MSKVSIEIEYEEKYGNLMFVEKCERAKFYLDNIFPEISDLIEINIVYIQPEYEIDDSVKDLVMLIENENGRNKNFKVDNFIPAVNKYLDEFKKVKWYSAPCIGDYYLIEMPKYIDEMFQNSMDSLNDHDHSKNYICKIYFESEKILIYTYKIKDYIKLKNKMKDSAYDKLHKIEEYVALEAIMQTILLYIAKENKEMVIKTEDDKKNDIKVLKENIINSLLVKYNFPDKDTLNKISNLTYENTKCSANMIIFDDEWDVLEKDLECNSILLDKPVVIENKNLRKVRKLLEMATDESYLLISNKLEIKGLIPQEAIQKNNTIIKFDGNMKWCIYRNKLKLLSYAYEEIKFIEQKDFSEKYQTKICEYLGVDMKSDKYNKFNTLIENLAEQTHGTMLLITNAAEKVVNRLCDFGRGVKTKKFNLLEKRPMLNNLSSIDGAIVIDENCICYAIGVILDGTACKYGDSGRGARYNSACTFISNQVTEKGEWEDERYIAIVISEDRTIDIISLLDVMK